MDEVQFEEWWEGAERYVQLMTDHYNLLQSAFFDVLSRLPKESRDRFFEMYPHVICIGDYAAVGAFWVTTASTEPQCVHFIFIRHDILKRKGLRDTIAHEIAHLLRGDHAVVGTQAGDEIQHEKGADDLSQSWGFKRRYSAARLAKMQQTARNIKT